MALFIVFTYLESWYTSPSLLGAPSNDLQLYSRIQLFGKVDKMVAGAATTGLNRHTWYLTEELIVVALSDDSISKDVHNSLAKQIGLLPSAANLPIKKPALPTILKILHSL